MNQEQLHQARRDFLVTSASGIGTLALASLLGEDRLLAKESRSPLAPRSPHFAARAKACICIYLEGAPSQIDLFDPKPKLNELNGQKLPESFTKNVRFAFLQKDTATVLGSPRKWKKHGQSGMDLSELLPHLATCVDDIAFVRSMHTEAFNHHPGQLLMNTGSTMFGRPSMGSWLNYGLGSESKNLPGYVVLTAGRGTSGGTSNWGSGFLPSSYAGVLFRNSGDPVLNLSNPAGLSDAMQKATIEAVRDLNGIRHATIGDPEINSRIAAYELAFRMQAEAPEARGVAGTAIRERRTVVDNDISANRDRHADNCLPTAQSVFRSIVRCIGRLGRDTLAHAWVWQFQLGAHPHGNRYTYTIRSIHGSR